MELIYRRCCLSFPIPHGMSKVIYLITLMWFYVAMRANKKRKSHLCHAGNRRASEVVEALVSSSKHGGRLSLEGDL